MIYGLCFLNDGICFGAKQHATFALPRAGGDRGTRACLPGLSRVPVRVRVRGLWFWFRFHVYGLWFHGSWFIVYGLWFIVHDLWLFVHGL